MLLIILLRWWVGMFVVILIVIFDELLISKLGKCVGKMIGLCLELL